MNLLKIKRCGFCVEAEEVKNHEDDLVLRWRCEVVGWTARQDAPTRDLLMGYSLSILGIQT